MDRFRVWAVCLTIAAGSVTVLMGAKGDPAKGKEVFETTCTMCHNADSEEKKMGPGLKGLFKRDKLNDGKKASEANIRARIEDGGQGMPGYKDTLEDQQKEDLIAYLKTL
jgi:cytochrome c